MKRFLIVTAVAALLATPIALAQSSHGRGHQPMSPPAASSPSPQQTPGNPNAATPGTPATPATPAAPPTGDVPGSPATPATPAIPAAPSPNATQPSPNANANPQGCRTRKEAGEPCACRSDTSRIGVSTPSENGQNVCVRPG